MAGTRAAERSVEADGPYAGRLSHSVAYVPSFGRDFVIQAGGMSQLLARILVSAIREPKGYWHLVLEDMYMTIRRSWAPIAAAVAGFLLFLSISVVQFFQLVGATSLFGPLIFIETARMFAIWIDAMVIAGVVGASMTAELGARKVREELDAMEVMGINPTRELAVPRVISLTLILTLVSIPSLLVALASLAIAAFVVAGMPPSDFFNNVFIVVFPLDILAFVINSVLVGLLIGTVCCYKGLTASGGAIGLGRAVNQAVVISFTGVFVLQIAYQALVLGLFPSLGEIR